MKEIQHTWRQCYVSICCFFSNIDPDVSFKRALLNGMLAYYIFILNEKINFLSRLSDISAKPHSPKEK